MTWDIYSEWFLKTYYDKFPIEDLSKAIGKSKGSIRKKICRMGLNRELRKLVKCRKCGTLRAVKHTQQRATCAKCKNIFIIKNAVCVAYNLTKEAAASKLIKIYEDELDGL